MQFSKLLRPQKDWHTASATTHWADQHLSVTTETVSTPTHPKPRPWTIVHRKAAVVIAPMTNDGSFLLIKQERVPIRATIWEMPAGQIDNDTEPDQSQIEAVAHRELHEETGYELGPDGELISLGHFFTSPGFTDEQCYLFLARYVRPSPVHTPEEGEAILECRAFSAQELGRMIAENEIRDSNTLTTCARLLAMGFMAFSIDATRRVSQSETSTKSDR